jgi:hypothetical protein
LGLVDICGLSLDGWTGLKTGPYRRWESANVWLTVYPPPRSFFGSADSKGL